MHLRLVFKTLKANKLFVKKSKCEFGQQQIEYLGYVISQEGVAADKGKIQAMINWPQPKTI